MEVFLCRLQIYFRSGSCCNFYLASFCFEVPKSFLLSFVCKVTKTFQSNVFAERFKAVLQICINCLHLFIFRFWVVNVKTTFENGTVRSGEMSPSKRFNSTSSNSDNLYCRYFDWTSDRQFNITCRKSNSIQTVSFWIKNYNAATRDRTGDLQIFSLTLSQLSYHGSFKCCKIIIVINYKNFKSKLVSKFSRIKWYSKRSSKAQRKPSKKTIQNFSSEIDSPEN